MDMLQIAGIALISAFLATLLKEQKPNLAFLFIVFVGSSIFLFLIGKISEIINIVTVLANYAQVESIYLSTILKVIGITYIAEYASQLTKDIGQASLAAKIELAGKIIILSLALPIIMAIIENIVQLFPLDSLAFQ